MADSVRVTLTNNEATGSDSETIVDLPTNGIPQNLDKITSNANVSANTIRHDGNDIIITFSPPNNRQTVGPGETKNLSPNGSARSLMGETLVANKNTKF